MFRTSLFRCSKHVSESMFQRHGMSGWVVLLVCFGSSCILGGLKHRTGRWITWSKARKLMKIGTRGWSYHVQLLHLVKTAREAFKTAIQNVYFKNLCSLVHALPHPSFKHFGKSWFLIMFHSIHWPLPP